MNHEDRDQAVQNPSARTWRGIKLSAVAVCALMLTGIVTLMVLAAGKDEDIAGLVAPALLLALISGSVATTIAILEKRSRHGK